MNLRISPTYIICIDYLIGDGLEAERKCACVSYLSSPIEISLFSICALLHSNIFWFYISKSSVTAIFSVYFVNEKDIILSHNMRKFLHDAMHILYINWFSYFTICSQIISRNLLFTVSHIKLLDNSMNLSLICMLYMIQTIPHLLYWINSVNESVMYVW